MLKHLLESMLEGELNSHLAESKSAGVSNGRNGKTKKTVRSLNSGHLEIESSRDREGTFTPKIIPKRQLIVTSELEDKVLAMYAKGMSTRDISSFIGEMYAMEISATEISHITAPAARRLRHPDAHRVAHPPAGGGLPICFPGLHPL